METNISLPGKLKVFYEKPVPWQRQRQTLLIFLIKFWQLIFFAFIFVLNIVVFTKKYKSYSTFLYVFMGVLFYYPTFDTWNN